MNKKQIAITLGIMCFILTLAICIQIKTMEDANSTAKQTLSDNALRDEVLKWKEKYDNMSQELEKVEKRLVQVRQTATQDDKISLAKEEELKKSNTLLGLTKVKGEGIVIELQDGKRDETGLLIENISGKMVHAEDLLSLVNELRNAGAEAIEINGQRIINTSSITCEGSVIKINGEIIGNPFTIKAIGYQGLLYGQITRIGSYIELMAERGVNINDVRQESEIVINKYTGAMNYKYIKAVSNK